METNLHRREADIEEFGKELQTQYAIQPFLGVRKMGVFLGSAD